MLTRASIGMPPSFVRQITCPLNGHFISLKYSFSFRNVLINLKMKRIIEV